MSLNTGVRMKGEEFRFPETRRFFSKEANFVLVLFVRLEHDWASSSELCEIGVST